MKRPVSIPWVAVAAVALLGAACTRKTTTPEAMMSESPGGAMMAMQPGADTMKAHITSPGDGTKITDNFALISVATSGYQNTCETAGKPAQAGQGHYHVAIDKASNLVDMFCTPQARISMQNLKPGNHKLIVLPAQNDHVEVEKNESSISIDYEPSSPLPELKDASFPGKPSIKITNITPNQTVSGSFDVAVSVSNFNVNCDLEAKPDVAGYGHWHLNADSMTGAMMGMGTMLRMGCSTVIHASTAGWKTGETHTLIALLVDNGHAPLSPPVADRVDVKIG